MNVRNKFFALNLDKINELIDTNKSDEDITYTEVLALLYLIQDIKYNKNTIAISQDDKKYMQENLGMSVSSVNHFFTKMVKLGIFTRFKKDNYYIKKEVINYGPAPDESGKFVKVHSYSLFQNLKNSEAKMSSTEIKLFLYILKDIEFKKDSAKFGGNTITLTKDNRIKIAERFDISERSFKTFIARAKELNLIIKINNTIYKINDKFIVFCGDFDVEPGIVERATKRDISEIPDFSENRKKRNRAINQFFEGGGNNDK